MDAESFFTRWSRRKAETVQAPVPPANDLPLAAEEPAKPPPTLEDVAALTPESDFKPFVARGVDENVRRSAMKKLFADPQFNVMDGLDIYIGDYNTFEPIPPEMLLALNHAKTLLNPLAHLEKPLMSLLQTSQAEPESDPPSEPEQIAEAPQQLAAQDGSEELPVADAAAATIEDDLLNTPEKSSDDNPI